MRRVGWLLLAAILGLCAGSTRGSKSAEVTPTGLELAETRASFLDARKASEVYANIVAVLAGFALTSLILVVSVAATTRPPAETHVRLAYSTGLVGAGFIGCILAAFVLAALAAESAVVPHLYRSLIFIGVVIAVSATAFLAALEALAVSYVPDVAAVFVLVCGLSPVLASVCVAAPFIDAARMVGASEVGATTIAKQSVVASFAPMVVALAVRLAGGPLVVSDRSLVIGLASIHLVAIAVFTLMAAAASMPRDRSNGGPRPSDVVGSCLAIGTLAAVVLATLP